MTSKPLRHHHKIRHIKKRQKDLIYDWLDNPSDEPWYEKDLKMRVTTPTLCSCWLCGNPRKFYGNGKSSKTLQELKAVNDERFGHQEYASLCLDVA